MSEQVQIATAIITTLKANGALTSLLNTYASAAAVFTHVPQDLELYPYVVMLDLAMDNADNDAEFAFDGVFNVHSWSDQRNMDVIGAIQKAVYDALHHAEFTMADYSLVDIHQEFSTILHDPDGITMHGVQRYRIQIETETT